MNDRQTRTRSPMRNILLLTAIAITGAVTWYVASGGLSDPTENVIDAGSRAAQDVKAFSSNSTDIGFELSGKNTDIKWTGSNSIGQTPTGFFYDLVGNSVIDGESQKLKHFEVLIDMNGVKAMASSLTKKLKHNGFFEVDRFPHAKFVSTSINYDAVADESQASSCVVEGNFQLRDVTRSIKIPMQVTSEGKTLKLSSKFKINRKDYGVVYSDSTADQLIRDSVMLEIEIDSTRESGDALATEKPIVSDRIETSSEKAIQQSNFTETIKPTLVEFDMIFVPGDTAKGIQSFCIGKTEVTWNEFDYWALCKNMSDKDSINEISQQLRPSAPHDLEKIYRGWGRENQPVVGVSRLSAELYCKWLSQQTGKKYRLPTSTEWELAFELGGGDLNAATDSNELAESAWFDENAISTDEEGFDFERAMRVGTLKPNQLGIHDMLGNASEWVMKKGSNEKIVRGGHFKLSADELIGAHEETEDQNIWNKDYPQDPKSKWWYVNADYVGFRVVCETQ